jgi:hypothetical protein
MTEPISLDNARIDRAKNSERTTPKQILTYVIDLIDKGELDPQNLVIFAATNEAEYVQYREFWSDTTKVDAYIIASKLKALCWKTLERPETS